jgi:hypothetical protein
MILPESPCALQSQKIAQVVSALIPSVQGIQYGSNGEFDVVGDQVEGRAPIVRTPRNFPPNKKQRSQRESPAGAATASRVWHLRNQNLLRRNFTIAAARKLSRPMSASAATK